MGKADKHSARRRARVEETEEKWGGRTSTDPKQKTQPDGDEELCQYGLCGDACMPLRWKDTKKARSLKKKNMEAEGQSDVKHRLQRAKIGYSLKKLYSVCQRFYKFCLINSQTR